MDSRVEPMLAAHRRILAYEPGIAEMLADPVVCQVMDRDGVSREALLDLLHTAQATRRARQVAAAD